MRTPTKLAGIAAAVLAVTALTGGVASAQSGPPTPSGSTATETATGTDTDTDTLQQGDQTTPDTAAEQANETANETAAESAGESAAADDGPGGHEDPPGDIQHEGGANEK